MKWKQSWSAPGDFVGEWHSEDGILILHQVPGGHPQLLPTLPLDPKYRSVRDTYPYLKDPAAQQWLEQILETGKIPNSEWKEPEGFWDWEIYKYSLYKKKDDETSELAQYIRQQVNRDANIGDPHLILGVGMYENNGFYIGYVF